LFQCKFRAKFATIANEIVVKKIGSLTIRDQVAILDKIKKVLALA